MKQSPFSLIFRILQDSMSSTYDNEGPLPWFRVEMSIFYIVFFVVFPFFFVNIFVALIIVTFNELGEAELQDDMDKNQVCSYTSCFMFQARAKTFCNCCKIKLCNGEGGEHKQKRKTILTKNPLAGVTINVPSQKVILPSEHILSAEGSETDWPLLQFTRSIFIWLKEITTVPTSAPGGKN